MIKDLLSICAEFLAFICVLCVPTALIISINTLFGAGIELNFLTWLSAAFLTVLFIVASK